MIESRGPDASAQGPDRKNEPSRHFGLLIASAILTSVVAAFALGYGIRTGIVAVKSLAYQTALAAIGSWLCLSACRIRRRLREAEEYLQRGTAEGPGESKSPEWGERGFSEREEIYDVALGDAEHARRIHYLFLAVCPTVAILLLTLFELWRQPDALAVLSQGQAAALGIVSLVASCMWLALSRSYAAITEDELPEAPGQVLAFRETQWASVLVSAAIFGSLVWLPLELWVGRVVLIWVVAVSGEQLVRLGLAWLWSGPEKRQFLPPLRLVLREAVLVRGNPISSLFETIELRFGVSFRSSWAIRFVRSAAMPTVLLAALLFWGLSCLSMVGPSELGVRETFGRISGTRLKPGLHFKLPWPFGRVLRYPVKQVFAKPIGFVADRARPRAFLWSKAHAKEEFGLVLGDGTEVVVVDAMVYFKIRDDEEGFLDYVYQFQNPVEALEGYGYRALMEQTRAATLEEVLSANRAQFAQRLEDSLRDYAAANHLGINVVEVALINLHPPIEAAPDYLDVISARIDADRFEVEATGKEQVRIEEAETESGSTVATSRVDAAKRVSVASEESAQFVAVGKAFSVAPEAFKLRLRGDTVEEILGAKPLILVDKTFIGEAGEMLLDLRPNVQDRDSAIFGEKKYGNNQR